VVEDHWTLEGGGGRGTGAGGLGSFPGSIPGSAR
jgi:hypothetical protein